MTQVSINLYDLSQGMAKSMSQMLIGRQIEGIWHTGVIVFGYEYYYSGGIQKDLAGHTSAGVPLRTIPIGTTLLDQETFEQFLQEISPRYTVETYRLLEHNCNNFSDEACRFLTGVGIPSYIVDLPREVLSTPLGQSLKPMIDSLYAGGNPLKNDPNTSMFGNNIMSPLASSPSQPKYPLIQGASTYNYAAANVDKIYDRLFENSAEFQKTLETPDNPNPLSSPRAVGIINQADKDLLVSPEVKQWFIDVCQNPKRREPTPENAIPKGIIAILTRLRCLWPTELLLPVFDLMRIVSLHFKGAETFCKEPTDSGAQPSEGAQVVHAPLSIVTLFKQFVIPPLGEDVSSQSGKLPPKAGAKLMTGRIAVNLFATTHGAQFITGSSHISLFIEGALSLIREKFPQLIQTGACLLQNIIITLGSEKESTNILTENGIRELSVAIKQQYLLLSTSQTSPSLDTITVLLKVFGVLLVDNEVAVAIFHTLPEDTICSTELDLIRKSPNYETPSKIAGEICDILEL